MAPAREERGDRGNYSSYEEGDLQSVVRHAIGIARSLVFYSRIEGL